MAGDTPRRGSPISAFIPGLVVTALAAACTSTPPPRGLEIVEPERPPPEPVEVERAQRRLRELEDYYGPIDGRLTAETRVALARFQRRAGLEVSGELDEATRDALEARVPAAPEAPAPELAPPELPSAEALIAPEPERPQPPAEWLDPLLREVADDLEEASRAAARLLSQGEGGGPAAQADRVGQADRILSEARREGFERIVAARVEAGFAPLPEPLLQALRQALFERNLLIRPENRGWGRDEAEAVRWMERSLGLEPSGLPTLPLLEALGIDPLPIFALGRGSPGQTAIQTGP